MKIDNENIRYIYCYYKHNKELSQCVPAIYRPKEFNENIKKFTKQFDSILFNDGLNLNKAINKVKTKINKSYHSNLLVSKFSDLSSADINTIKRKLQINKLKDPSKRKYNIPEERKSVLKIYLYDINTRAVIEFTSIREIIFFLELKGTYKSCYSYIYGAVKGKSKLQNRYYVNFENEFDFLNEVFYKFFVYDAQTNKTYKNLSLSEVGELIKKNNKTYSSSSMYSAIKHKSILYGRYFVSFKDDITIYNFPKLDKYLNKKS